VLTPTLQTRSQSLEFAGDSASTVNQLCCGGPAAMDRVQEVNSFCPEVFKPENICPMYFGTDCYLTGMWSDVIFASDSTSVLWKSMV